MSNHVICVGSGRLAGQVARRLQEKNYEVRRITSEADPPADSHSRRSAIEHLSGVFREAGIESAGAVYLLDDEDRRNIEMALVAISENRRVPIIVSLFNEALGSHLQATHPNLRVHSPARIACPRFVECIRAESAWKPSYRPPPVERVGRRNPLEQRSLLQVYSLAAAFAILLLVGVVFFHQVEGLSWMDAAYSIARVVASDDFGDPRTHSSPGEKVFGILLMLSAVALVAITIALIADRMVKRNAEIALGRRRYRLKGHVIVCGLGRVGAQIVDELLRAGETVLVIEEKPDNRFLATVRAHGARVLVGDASLTNNLSDAGVEKAQALVSVINDDLRNLEIGLNARSLQPDLRLILRIFDKGIAEEMREHLDIHFALSTSVIAAERLVEILEQGAGGQTEA